MVREVHSSFAWTHCLKILPLASPLPSAASAYQLQPLGSKKRCLLEQLVGGQSCPAVGNMPTRGNQLKEAQAFGGPGFYRPRILEALAAGGMQTRVKY